MAFSTHFYSADVGEDITVGFDFSMNLRGRITRCSIGAGLAVHSIERVAVVHRGSRRSRGAVAEQRFVPGILPLERLILKLGPVTTRLKEPPHCSPIDCLSGQIVVVASFDTRAVISGWHYVGGRSLRCGDSAEREREQKQLGHSSSE